MDSVFLTAVVDHLRQRLEGASLGRVWQPAATTLVLDLRSSDGRFLLVSCNPTDPELYLTSRAISDLEPKGSAERAFAALLRKRLRGSRVERIAMHPSDRIVAFEFQPFGASGNRERLELVVALTGRSANAYLVDESGTLVGSLRPAPLPGVDPPRLPPDAWSERQDPELLPAKLFTVTTERGTRLVLSPGRSEPPHGTPFETFDDPSAAADARARRLESERALSAARQGVRQRARVALERAQRLQLAIRTDIANAAGHERDRELAESLLAQLGTARAENGHMAFVDLYSDDQRTVSVPCDDGETPQSVAERLFARQRKAKRTREKAGARLVDVNRDVERLEAVVSRIDAAVDLADLAVAERELDSVLGVRRVAKPAGGRAVVPAVVRGARRFVSTDGYEILVGRSSSANDALTFKTARPSDLWLHTADYPGSHVVVRNPVRSAVPQRTLREAAQLAAFYSEARNNAVVDVRYTERRFVTKPRGAAPGLVRIAHFKTIAVSPAADLDRPPAE